MRPRQSVLYKASIDSAMFLLKSILVARLRCNTEQVEIACQSQQSEKVENAVVKHQLEKR